MAETIGSLVDKITIADLKIFHMQEQIDRPDAAPEHKDRCRQKRNILDRQKKDLVQECSDLMKAVQKGKTKLKVYRQFKMYNDPIYRTNPKT